MHQITPKKGAHIGLMQEVKTKSEYFEKHAPESLCIQQITIDDEELLRALGSPRPPAEKGVHLRSIFP